ncbi:hypothetical protein BGZ88_011040 [Linnemannia elongata]|nr:hypothetical protein BGZ88_011040 [Linnemannia elongata]
MFEQMSIENSQLKTKLDIAVSCVDKMLVENTRLETKLDLAGYRMDEMQSTIDNGVSMTIGIDNGIKAIQEEADKRLRKVARMFVLVDHDDVRSGKLNTDDYYRDFTGGTSISLSNKSLHKRFDPEKLIWEDTKFLKTCHRYSFGSLSPGALYTRDISR